MCICDIDEKIGYIEASQNPLSADIGIIRDAGVLWLYDVGNGDEGLLKIPDGCHSVVISHFHPDHCGNILKVDADKIYVSRETYKHIMKSVSLADKDENAIDELHIEDRLIVVDKDIYLGKMHIFLLPSTHAQGCLGMEVDEKYAFVGDAIYGKEKGGKHVYNAQLLKEEIEKLKSLKAEKLLISHHRGMLTDKNHMIAFLEKIYARREKNNPYIEWNTR